jgi:hypothetical protein
MRRQLFFSPLKGSFAAHVEVFYNNLAGLVDDGDVAKVIIGVVGAVFQSRCGRG